MVYIKIYFIDNREPITVLCNNVDVCFNQTCVVIHGGKYDGQVIYNACGAEVIGPSNKREKL